MLDSLAEEGLRGGDELGLWQMFQGFQLSFIIRILMRRSRILSGCVLRGACDFALNSRKIVLSLVRLRLRLLGQAVLDDALSEQGCLLHQVGADLADALLLLLYALVRACQLRVLYHVLELHMQFVIIEQRDRRALLRAHAHLVILENALSLPRFPDLAGAVRNMGDQGRVA